MTLLLGLQVASLGVSRAANEECFGCHEMEGLERAEGGTPGELLVDPKVVEASVHGALSCKDCHQDAELADGEHQRDLGPVNCGQCHDGVAERYKASLHGQLAEKGERLAPRCHDCHGNHDIQAAQAAGSKVSKFHVPFVCGRCHKEGTEVTRTYDIPQDKILAHYSQSMHGEGLFKKGLTVTAVCTDCHNSHDILPHTDSSSSIHRDNVAQTCRKCHGLVEEVHAKVIRGELWEKEPQKIPVCIDCHAPHRIRKVFYELGMADQDCLKCHSSPDGDGRSLHVDMKELNGSAHRGIACAQCHTGVSPTGERPCATVAPKVDCSICHADVMKTYGASIHGMLAGRGKKEAPGCHDCHGDHGIKAQDDSSSPIFPTNVPNLCGKCHRDGQAATMGHKTNEQAIVEHYVESIHGKGLLKSGLVVTAMCTDCHTAHHVLPAANEASTVNRNNIAITCSKCHQGIYQKYTQSVHFASEANPNKKYPMCNDCHSAHSIARTDMDKFRSDMVGQCGHCHEAITESYFDTFHGKVSKLGYNKAAKCYDCHGSHEILPTWDPQSTLSRQNITGTCGKCHSGSNRQFAGYLTHATHHDPDKYPVLYYSFWFMTILLMGTLAFFGTHTLLWLPRSLQERRKRKAVAREAGEREVQRFSRVERQLHILVIVSFLGLALTGMTLKFSYTGWAQWLSRLLGGFESAAFIHRGCAIITFFYFGMHVIELFRKKRRQGKGWRGFLFGSDSMLPNRTDLREFKGTLYWFLGLGPRPAYGRWTYWEKFDYFAVFWGVLVIGSTGLVLWFPELFTLVLPGWFINVATIVHSDEALLAAGFIFSVHFFNTHFRPEKFPMDTVIFTGSMPLEEFKTDRPREYEEMVQSGVLERHLVDPPAPSLVKGARIFGTIALSIGLILIVLIVLAEIFSYK